MKLNGITATIIGISLIAIACQADGQAPAAQTSLAPVAPAQVTATALPEAVEEPVHGHAPEQTTTLADGRYMRRQVVPHAMGTTRKAPTSHLPWQAIL
jgi:hypothetical protein